MDVGNVWLGVAQLLWAALQFVPTPFKFLGAVVFWVLGQDDLDRGRGGAMTERGGWRKLTALVLLGAGLLDVGLWAAVGLAGVGAWLTANGVYVAIGSLMGLALVALVWGLWGVVAWFGEWDGRGG